MGALSVGVATTARARYKQNNTLPGVASAAAAAAQQARERRGRILTTPVRSLEAHPVRSQEPSPSAHHREEPRPPPSCAAAVNKILSILLNHVFRSAASLSLRPPIPSPTPLLIPSVHHAQQPPRHKICTTGVNGNSCCLTAPACFSFRSNHRAPRFPTFLLRQYSPTFVPLPPHDSVAQHNRTTTPSKPTRVVICDNGVRGIPCYAPHAWP